MGFEGGKRVGEDYPGRYGRGKVLRVEGTQRDIFPGLDVTCRPYRVLVDHAGVATLAGDYGWWWVHRQDEKGTYNHS